MSVEGIYLASVMMIYFAPSQISSFETCQDFSLNDNSTGNGIMGTKSHNTKKVSHDNKHSSIELNKDLGAVE